MSDDVLLSVRTEGGLLPDELLHRVRGMESDLPHMKPEDYRLVAERREDAMNRAWARLKAVYRDFRDRFDEEASVALTRERWLLPLFQALDYGRLSRTGGMTIDGQDFAISHSYWHSPVHLMGWNVPLDTRSAGVGGASQASPHGLVQDFLNRSDEHLWGFVSNGRVLRVLRDHLSLTRQAYVEFDLEAIFEGDQWFDFQLLWLVCHESRVRAERPEQCALEAWFEAARDQGVRAMDQLREGVEAAIERLGQGFVAHRANSALRTRLESGDLSTQDLYRQVLRLVYRLIFLFVAEERGVLLDPTADPEARARYERFYSTRALRDLADRRSGTSHGDRWRALRVVMGQLQGGGPALGLPALGSFLWSDEAIPDLAGAELANENLLAAVRRLSRLEDRKQKQSWRVSWRNVGAEELGSVYESLLERHPEVDAKAGRFTLKTAAGNDRKTTGSYYTPSSLVDCLLDSALDPVLDEAVKGKRGEEAEKALLALTVCDPACGSGHFLVAAARRIARRLAQVRSGDVEPSPEATRQALRDVVGRCLYGVDVNPMAVELCKVSLWMEALEPGRPLSFLDGHIQCGNALLGTTPALMSRGIPNDAWKPITGDDKEVAKRLKARNRQELKNPTQGGMFGLWAADSAGSGTRYLDLPSRSKMVEDRADDSIDAVHEKEAAWDRLVRSNEARQAKLLADAWCAAFVWPKEAGFEDSAPTHGLWSGIKRDPTSAPAATVAQVRKLAREYQFFHWHLAFPHVFGRTKQEVGKGETTGWAGGFDVVLGNPPWEKINFRLEEFFAASRPEIANARTKAARARLVEALEHEDSELFAAYQQRRRRQDGQSLFFRTGGRFPGAGASRINLYSVFAECGASLLTGRGILGLLLPSGIATDHANRVLFSSLHRGGQLRTVLDFENRRGLFPAVHRSFHFCIFVASGPQRESNTASFCFFLESPSQIGAEAQPYTLTAMDVERLNPETRTAPVFRDPRDARIAVSVYSTFRERPESDPQGQEAWPGRPRTPFNMSNDSPLFGPSSWELTADAETAEWARLYEAKLIWQFNHRMASFRSGGTLEASTADALRNPDYSVHTRFTAPRRELEARFNGRWFLAFRDVTGAVNERTTVAAIIPAEAAGHSLTLITGLSAQAAAWVAGAMNSFPYDYLARQKVAGNHLTQSIWRQIPSPPPQNQGDSWVPALVLELSYVAWDLAPFAIELGVDTPPFRWSDERRFLLRAELDAAFFHLYGIDRDDVDYIMETFPIVKKNDVKAHGSYRTKEAILDIYDRMQQAIDTGVPYETVLDPPPAHPSLTHPPRDTSS